MLLLIDNYDSFVYNLARYFEELGIEVEVVRNDAMSVEEVIGRSPEAIVLSPGPCGPDNAGISIELVREVLGRIPLMGVCLGHQVLAAATGGRVVRAPQPVHGRVTPIEHDEGGAEADGLFAGLTTPLIATRYHSLIVESEELPAAWQVTARTRDGLVMAMSHREHPAVGVQFHPESVLTGSGHQLLWNFLVLSGVVDGPMPAVPNPAPLARGHHAVGSVDRYRADVVFPDVEAPSSTVLHW